MFDLSGKTAFITGATGAIGSVIAKTFHKQGAKVVLSGTNVSILENLVSELSEDAFSYNLNLSNVNDIPKIYSEIEKNVGFIDILVNNAGINRDKLFVRMTDDSWQEVMNVNLTAPFVLMRESVRSMVKARKGRIINISSIVGIAGNPGQANYSAAKAGLIGMTKTVAAEIASRGITVNCIAPGFIKSAMTDRLEDKQKQKLVDNIPMRKIGIPEDVASAAVFLASDEAQYITGQTIHINGGMLMV
ncbi:MAG: 3-oxoacyl-[acyl-carrier-protein] reductase [Holosporales bacterium]|jgi:3-oxoacyl-[acyl-carrier protein] reductase|nr:3-oxoacyl-[acyl-carrier-protein] reductase [Holosporales bacterium]